MVRVLPIHFGVVLGCKGGGGKKKPFRSRHSKQSYRPDIPPMPGLEKVYFVVLGFKGGGGKKKLVGPESFSGAGIPDRAIGQIFHHARA